MRTFALLLLCIPLSALATEVDKAEAAKQTALASLYSGAGDWENAHIALQRAVDADPDDCSTQQALGQFYLEQGKASEALPHLANAAELYADWDALSLEERTEILDAPKEGIFSRPEWLYPRMGIGLLWEQSDVFQSALPEADVLRIPLYRGEGGVDSSFIEIELPDGSLHLFALGIGGASSEVTSAFAEAAGAKLSTRRVGSNNESREVALIPSMQLGEATIEGFTVEIESTGSRTALPVSGTLQLRGIADGLAFAILPSQGVLLLAKPSLGPEMLAAIEGGARMPYTAEPWSQQKDGRERTWDLIPHPWLYPARVNGVDTQMTLVEGDILNLARDLTEGWTPAWKSGTIGHHSVKLEIGQKQESGEYPLSMDVLANEDEDSVLGRHPEGGYLGIEGFDIALDPSTSTLVISKSSTDTRATWWDTAIANALEEDEEAEDDTEAEPKAEEPDSDDGRRAQDGSCHKAQSDLSMAHLATGQFDRVLNQDYAQEDMNYMVPLIVGNAMVVSGKASEAEPAYRQAMQLNKSEGAMGLGLSLYAQGKGRQATDIFGKSVLSNPDSLQIANLYAESMALSQGMEAAIEAVAVLAASNPQNATWALAMARTLAMAEADTTQALTHAIALFEAAISKNPDGELIGQYALALVLAERYEEATIMADASLKVQANSPSALLALSRMALNEGQIDFAKSLRQRAAFSNFDNPAYAALLKP